MYNISRKSRVRRFLHIAEIIVENAKVMSKGQITMPKDIREAQN